MREGRSCRTDRRDLGRRAIAIALSATLLFGAVGAPPARAAGLDEGWNPSSLTLVVLDFFFPGLGQRISNGYISKEALHCAEYALWTILAQKAGEWWSPPKIEMARQELFRQGYVDLAANLGWLGLKMAALESGAVPDTPQARTEVFILFLQTLLTAGVNIHDLLDGSGSASKPWTNAIRTNGFDGRSLGYSIAMISAIGQCIADIAVMVDKLIAELEAIEATLATARVQLVQINTGLGNLWQTTSGPGQRGIECGDVAAYITHNLCRYVGGIERTIPIASWFTGQNVANECGVSINNDTYSRCHRAHCPRVCGDLLTGKKADGTVQAGEEEEFMGKCLLTCNTKSDPLNEAAYTNGFPSHCPTNDAGIRNLASYGGCRQMNDPGTYTCIKEGDCR